MSNANSGNPDVALDLCTGTMAFYPPQRGSRANEMDMSTKAMDSKSVCPQLYLALQSG